MNRSTYPDEVVDYMADYYLSREDLHEQINFEQFIRRPLAYGFVPPMIKEEEMECSY